MLDLTEGQIFRLLHGNSKKKDVLQCSVKIEKTGEHCPETPTKELNGNPVCEKCYNTWVSILPVTK